MAEIKTDRNISRVLGQDQTTSVSRVTYNTHDVMKS